MGSVVNFEITFDSDLVESVAGHPDVYYYHSEDCHQRKNWKPVFGAYWWVIGRNEDGVPVGHFILEAVSSVFYEIHTAMLPDYVEDVKRDWHENVKSFLRKEFPQIRLLRCACPDCYAPMQRWLLKHGWVEHSKNESVYLKEGDWHDLRTYLLEL